MPAPAPAPLPAFVHLYQWLTLSGYVVYVDGERVDTEADYVAAVRDVDFVRIYAYDRASEDRATPSVRHSAWFNVMFPAPCNCSDSESVQDFGVNAVSEAWEAAFARYIGW